MEKNVIVVGAGLAGMVAAYMAQKEGAKVLIIDRGSIGLGTNSAMANGVIAGPTGSYSRKEYIADTIDIGRRTNRRFMVEIAADEAESAISFLRSIGLNIVEGTDTYSVKSPDPEIIPGVAIVKKIAGAFHGLDRLSTLTGFYVTDIVRTEGSACGIRGLDTTGKEKTFAADAMVLATGGAGAIYLKNDNQKTIMGQGYWLAAKAGLALWDMEFIQYYPLVFSDPHLPSSIVFPPYNNAVELTNNRGEKILEKYQLGNINEAVLKKRDKFSAILFNELQSGPVWMDFRKVPSHLWKKHPLSLLTKMKFDFSSKPVSVSSAAHFFMGGVRIDEKGETELPGLFACGEVVSGLHGANRRGGNALLECIVYGTIAGRNAARYALKNDSKPFREKGTLQNDKIGGEGDLRAIRKEIREIAWNYAGVVRNESGIKEGLKRIEKVETALKEIALKSKKDIRLKLDLKSAAFITRTILTASLGRHESRGGFIRSDFPEEDVKWTKNSCLKYDVDNNTFSLAFADVE
jgi:succinate dehydrogenase/fumarate reductase flavoprotein subunit